MAIDQNSHDYSKSRKAPLTFGGVASLVVEILVRRSFQLRLPETEHGLFGTWVRLKRQCADCSSMMVGGLEVKTTTSKIVFSYTSRAIR